MTIFESIFIISRLVRNTGWGHLHKNLMPVESGVGNGGSWVEQGWEGDRALKLIEILEQSPQVYPYCHFYRYFPGPNSNTYGQWVLEQAGIDYRLGFKGIGKNYRILESLATSFLS